jgi:hypothetical protein
MGEQNSDKDKRRVAVELAKRLIVDSVWKTAGIEVRGLTFPQTNEIFENRGVSDLSVSDILVVNNIKHAWQFLVEHADEELACSTVFEYNRLVGDGVMDRPGLIRDHEITITGADYIPLPVAYESVEGEFHDAMARQTPELKAVSLFESISRGQWFNDGNKRTAMMAANHVLVHEGIGVMTVSQSQQRLFFDMLVDFYNSGDARELTAWLEENAVRHIPGGLSLVQQEQCLKRDAGIRTDDGPELGM